MKYYANMKYYLIHIHGCVDPELLGPYKDEKTRQAKARKIARPQDTVLWIDSKTRPNIGTYST